MPAFHIRPSEPHQFKAAWETTSSAVALGDSRSQPSPKVIATITQGDRIPSPKIATITLGDPRSQPSSRGNKGQPSPKATEYIRIAAWRRTERGDGAMLGNRKAARHPHVNAISTDARPSCNRFQAWQSALSPTLACPRCTRCRILLTHPHTGVQGVAGEV